MYLLHISTTHTKRERASEAEEAPTSDKTHKRHTHTRPGGTTSVCVVCLCVLVGGVVGERVPPSAISIRDTAPTVCTYCTLGSRSPHCRRALAPALKLPRIMRKRMWRDHTCITRSKQRIGASRIICRDFSEKKRAVFADGGRL